MHRLENYRQSIFFLLLLLLIFTCYSNTFNSSWQFDDYPNIIDNTIIHIDNLRFDTIYKTLFAKPFHPGSIERPISFLSFAFNWYIGQDNPFWYHIINIIIHTITAYFIFKCILLLISYSTHSNKYNEDDVVFIALLSATLWATNPVQTQAVTYIVQRMASMAAMFFILSIYHYIISRKSKNLHTTSRHLTLCVIFFTLSIGCKENAITLFPSLLLIEFIFFRETKYNIQIKILITINIILLLLSTAYIFKHYSQYFLSPVDNRPFSLIERLLTQSRIIVLYLSIVIYPSPNRLSIEHNVLLSTSITNPITTLFSILFILSLISYAILRREKYPLLSFAILFFLINHVVESTIIPLELIFEHRNYLPSFFLFLPIAVALHWSIKRTYASSKILHNCLLISIPGLLIAIGIGTYTRNDSWKTEESLWTDSLRKAPGNARPYARLAEIYGWKKANNPENFKIALALLQKSLNKETPRTTLKAALINNIGKLYALQGQFKQAIDYYNQSLQLNPNFINSRLDLSQALLILGNFNEAIKEIDIVINKSEPQSRFLELKGTILLWLNRPEESANCFQQAINIKDTPNSAHLFFNLGVALSRTGFPNRGEWCLRFARQNYPDNIRILYGLIEHCVLTGDNQAARNFAAELIGKVSIVALKKDLDSLSTDYLAIPINKDLIEPYIIEAARNFTTALEQNQTQKN